MVGLVGLPFRAGAFSFLAVAGAESAKKAGVFPPRFSGQRLDLGCSEKARFVGGTVSPAAPD